MGDVAAFMQEVEIQGLDVRPGHDGRGIERLRRVAAEVAEGSSNADMPRPE